MPALTAEELAPSSNWHHRDFGVEVPAIHLARLGMLGHVLIGPEGPLLVTGVGLIRITK